MYNNLSDLIVKMAMSSQIYLAYNICVSGTTEAISIIILLCSPHSPSMECVRSHSKKFLFWLRTFSQQWTRNSPRKSNFCLWATITIISYCKYFLSDLTKPVRAGLMSMQLQKNHMWSNGFPVRHIPCYLSIWLLNSWWLTFRKRIEHFVRNDPKS